MKTKKAKSLLELANLYNKKRNKFAYGKNEYEVAIAWIKNDITSSQLVNALNATGRKARDGNSRYFVAMAIKTGVMNGKIKIKIIP